VTRGHSPARILQRLEGSLAARDEDGRRYAVPVLGNGFNIQAFSEATPANNDPWTAATRAIMERLNPADRHRMRRWPGSHQGQYDVLDDAFEPAERYDQPSEFQRLLGEGLTSRSELGTGLDLYQNVAAAQFATILTTNIDEAFPALAGAMRRMPPGIYYAGELYRKSVVRFGNRAQSTEVWQMNGSAAMPAGIRLGIRRHADTISDMEMLRIELMNSWPRGPRGLEPPDSYARMRGPRPFSWYKMFLVRPLVFAGSSLDPTDWPMWWLLHQRARILAVFEPRHRPPTFVLTARTDPLPHLAHSPAGIERVEFPSFDDLWRFFRGVLAS